MRAFINTAGSIAVAGLTIGASWWHGCRSRLLADAGRGPSRSSRSTGRQASHEASRTKAAEDKSARRKGAAPGETNAKPARPPFSLEDEADALVLGIRMPAPWGDSRTSSRVCYRKRTGRGCDVGRRLDGAYAAGLLTGMSQTGKRPEFAVVTGASIGALIAPYAFLGPRYDEELKKQFTTITAGDIFEDRPTTDSLMDSWPLKRTIEKRVTPQLLADIAAEHKRGRRLLARHHQSRCRARVIWNLGAISVRGDDKALQLFRAVLLASARFRGLSPVLIEAESHGKPVHELHNDGTSRRRSSSRPESMLAGTGHRSPADQADLCDRQRQAVATVRDDDDADRRRARPLHLARAAIRMRIELLLTLAAARSWASP